MDKNSCQTLQPWRKILFRPLSISTAFTSGSSRTNWLVTTRPTSLGLTGLSGLPLILPQAKKGRVWSGFIHNFSNLDAILCIKYIKWSLKRAESELHSTFHFTEDMQTPSVNVMDALASHLEHGSSPSSFIMHQTGLPWEVILKVFISSKLKSSSYQYEEGKVRIYPISAPVLFMVSFIWSQHTIYISD